MERDLELGCDLFLTFSGMGGGGVYPCGARGFGFVMSLFVLVPTFEAWQYHTYL